MVYFGIFVLAACVTFCLVQSEGKNETEIRLI